MPRTHSRGRVDGTTHLANRREIPIFGLTKNPERSRYGDLYLDCQGDEKVTS